MAFASRLLSKSKQLHAAQILLRPEHALPVRSFAKGAAPSLKGDEMLKGIFLEVKNKFETAVGILKKEKITIDPDDPAVVSQYAKVMKTVREKANLFSESQRVQHTIQTKTQDIPDARTYLLTLQEIRVKRGLTDDIGAETMMMDALEKVEKQIKKPLMRNDKKGMALLMEEFDKINKKLGIRREDLPKYEEELELKIAKAQLQELKKDAVEAMETQKKREEFKDEEMPEVKSLDIRNFILRFYFFGCPSICFSLNNLDHLGSGLKLDSILKNKNVFRKLEYLWSSQVLCLDFTHFYTLH